MKRYKIKVTVEVRGSFYVDAKDVDHAEDIANEMKTSDIDFDEPERWDFDSIEEE